MKERKITVNLVMANVFAVVLFIVVSILSGLLWSAMRDGGFVLRVADDAGVYLLKTSLFVVAVIGGIVVHELIHGLTWAHYASSGWKSISFGVLWNMLTPYCHCNEPLKLRPYVVGALMPLVVLGVVPWIAGMAVGSPIVTIFGIVFITAAGGDILVVWKLRREKASVTVLDHPTEAGCVVYDE